MASSAVSPSATASLLACGFATAVAQAVLLREAMTALSGSELAWGVVLGLWLLGMAAGSRIGVAVRPRSAAWTPAAVILLSLLGVLLLRSAPVLAGVAAGEAVATWSAIWVWLAAVVPPGVAGGFAFPVLAEDLGRRDAAGAAYAVEAAGALAGGLIFTLILARLGTAFTLCASLAILVAILLGRRRWTWGVALLASAPVVAVPLSTALATVSWRLSGRPGSLAATIQTPQQRLELAGGQPAAVYADGHLLATFPDPYRVHPRAHLLMLLHPRPAAVLLVGGTASGDLIPMLTHPVHRLDIVEDDPALPSILSRWLGQALRQALLDPRVVVHRRDPVTVVRRGGPWDLILLLDGDPSTVRRNRTRTAEFFHACRDALRPGGVLAVRAGVGDTYLGGAAGRLLRILVSSLGRSFPEVQAIPGSEVLLVAATGQGQAPLDEDVLGSRWQERGLVDPFFPQEMIAVLLDPPRAADLRNAMSEAAPPNTIDRPRAVLLAAGLREGRGQPPILRAAQSLEGRSPLPLLLVLVAAGLVVMARGALRHNLGADTAVALGSSSMAWWLLLVGAWQATRGSVYSDIGALSATFMAGLAGGAWWTRRLREPASLLPWLLLTGGCLSALLASGLPAQAPRLCVVPLLALAGGTTGAAFPGIARLTGGRRTRAGAGRGFAADELGAAAGAILLGLLAIPWAGHAATAAGIGALDVAVGTALLLSTRGRADRTPTREREASAATEPAPTPPSES